MSRQQTQPLIDSVLSALNAPKTDQQILEQRKPASARRNSKLRNTRPDGSEAKASSPITWKVPGIADNTRVSTSFGEVPAQLLRKNDMVRTSDGSFKKIQWIDHLKLDEDYIDQHPEALPILIRAGAISNGFPSRNIEVSPAQIINISVHGVSKPVRADRLLNRPGVSRAARRFVVYTQFCCGEETFVKCENTWAASHTR